MRGPVRRWLFVAAACTAATTLAACSPPQLSKSSPPASARVSPSAQVASVRGGWSSAGAMSTQRGGPVTGVLVQGGRVLVTGSSDDLGMGSVDIYDPAGGWSPGPKLSSDLFGAVVAPLPGGRALLAGGVPYFGATDSPNLAPLATAMLFNPASRTWTKLPDMSVIRGDATATALPDGRVLVAGGYGGRLIQLTNPPHQGFQILPLASSQFFNPTSTTWTTGPVLAHGRFAHSAVLLTGGRILVVGGADQSSPERLLDSAELLDPATGRWLSAGTIGAARKQFTLTALPDGRALVTGGLAADGWTVLRSTLLYDPVKNQWLPGPDLANARTAHAAAVLADGRVLVTGGADQAGRLASSELFDPAANSWSSTGGLATARSSHLAMSLPNGRILVVGGRGPSNGLASSELFDPSAMGTPAGPRTPGGSGRWKLGATKPTSTDFSSAAAQLLPDGRVVIVPKYGLADFHVYDPKLDTWTTAFSRQAPQCNACAQGYTGPYPAFFLAAPMANAKVLLLTVDPQKAIATKAEIIDLRTGAATPAASPGKVDQSRLDLLPDGRIWMTAIQNLDRHAVIYDPTANRWAATSDLPLGLAESGAAMQTVTAVPGRRVLVTGSQKAMVFDPASGAWSDAGSFPGAWSQFSATGLASGDVLFAGGTMPAGTTTDGLPIQAVNSQVMRWDHTTGKLKSAENMPVGLYFHSAALLANGRVLLAGGSDVIGVNTNPDPVTRAEIYDPVARSWSLGAPLPAARYQAIGVTLGDGQVLLVGGSGMWLAGYPGDGQPSLVFAPQS